MAATPTLADGALTIWISSNRDAAALTEVAALYAQTTGVTVTVTAVDPLPERFRAAAGMGEGPDIILIGHDLMGGLATDGLITPLNPSAPWTAGILPSAMAAVRFDGSTWGYPVAVEALHLIYNRALIVEPPAAFEDIPMLPLSQGNRRVLWDYLNPYFTLPLLMAGGGYAFEQVDGSFDPAHTGIATEGAIAGAEVLLSLINDQFLPADLTYQIMDDAMNAGRVGMVINGSWAWENLTISGIDFGVAPIPSVAGHPSPTFITVQALAISSASANRELAMSFIENALTTDEGLAAWNVNGGLGALADLSAGSAQTDPHIAALLDIAANGVPLPNNPEMPVFWAAMHAALVAISTGAASPTEALNAAATRITAGYDPPEAG
jgi:maltose/maltodextrin transport system substrate-binding protein